MRSMTFFTKSLILVLTPLLVCSVTTAYAGSMTFQVAIDTTLFTGTGGDVEFQLSSSGNPIPVPVTASFNSYSSDMVLNGSTYNFTPGNPNVTITGDLSSNTLALYNDDSALQTADADQLVSQFGTYLNFTVTLTGDGIGASSASSPTLVVTAFDTLGNPLFSGPLEQNYSAVFFQVNADGTVDQTSYPAANTTASVPEPSSLTALTIGLLGLYWLRRPRLTKALSSIP